MSEGYKNCPYCGEEILAEALKCKHCGEWVNKQSSAVSYTIPDKELPPEARRYNWGVFLVGWIWGLCNGMPKNILITLISLWISCYIPILNFITSFVLLGFLIWAGTKGNQWAWNYKDWESVEQFNTHQRKWVWIPLLIFAGIFVVCFIFGMIIGLAAAIAEYAGD